MYGLGIRKGYLPANADPGDRDRFLQQISNLGAEAVMLLPRGMGADWQNGFDVEIEALSGGFKGEIFERLGARADTGITLALLGQNLTSEVQEGSLAAARVHGDVRQDYLEADVTTLQEWLTDQVVLPWARFNFSNAITRDDLPIPTWEVEPAEDADSASKTLGQVADAIETLTRVAPEVDRRALLERFDIPMLAESPTAQVAQPPPAQPQPPAPPPA
jgi:phage gp29-like protein